MQCVEKIFWDLQPDITLIGVKGPNLFSLWEGHVELGISLVRNPMNDSLVFVGSRAKDRSRVIELNSRFGLAGGINPIEVVSQCNFTGCRQNLGRITANLSEKNQAIALTYMATPNSKAVRIGYLISIQSGRDLIAAKVLKTTIYKSRSDFLKDLPRLNDLLRHNNADCIRVNTTRGPLIYFVPFRFSEWFTNPWAEIS